MSPEERVLAAFNHEEPDVIPIYDLVSSPAFYEHFGGRPLTLENAVELIPYAISRSLDMTRVFLPAPLGRRTDAQGFTFERTGWFNEWQISAPFNDMHGLVKFVKSEIERHDAMTVGDPDTELANLLEWKQRFGGTVIHASETGEPMQDAFIRIGLDWFVWLSDEHPELTRRWIDSIHGALMRRLQARPNLHQVSPVAWIFGDVAYKNKLIFSPAFLRRFGFFQRLAEIIDLFHCMQLKVIFHSDGDITRIIPELVAAGADAIAPIDTTAGMDLAALKRDFGNQLAFVGGIDVETVLHSGTPDLVRAVTRKAMQDAGKGGGLILGSSSEELFDNLPMENILAMYETVREKK
jgi:hypothetical protein